MKTKFYEGQRVKDCTFDPVRVGTVDELSTSETEMFPVCVDWGDENYDQYTPDGRIDIGRIPSLIPYEDEWVVVHTPVVTFEEYERVLVRDQLNQVWYPRMFMSYMDDGIYKYKTLEGSRWRYCRKWDRDLIGQVTVN